MQRGRVTEFTGQACSAQALIDQVGVRQSIVAWSETLSWQWPDGGSAAWNARYWNQGDLVPGAEVHAAINDAFMDQKSYSIGCYTASKLVMIQGILDYYRRVKKDEKTTALIEARLMLDGSPLVHIEPDAMWDFEDAADAESLARAGKLLSLLRSVGQKNFIPGDWSYLLNTDAVTAEKTGYEGSNAIYLGRGKFDDFYEDHHNYYTYKEKLNEVFQWRNQVFSSHRDVAKVHPLTGADYERLSKPPVENGIQLDLRVSPYMFGYQDLPLVK